MIRNASTSRNAWFSAALALAALLPAPAFGQGNDQFRISDLGGSNDPAFDASNPAVAYNRDRDEYLVVWSGDDDVGGLVDNELEIFGQRLDADGNEIGANDFRISDAGGTGDPTYDAQQPAVAYNPDREEYLVVWWGDDDVGGLVDNEFEIFGQRLDADGNEIGANDFRISDAGGTGNVSYEAQGPAVAYNPGRGEYFVVWWGDDDGGGLVDDEFEIFGQRLDADGNEIGANDEQISDMGGVGGVSYGAFEPAVAYNPVRGEYLIVWWADDDLGGMVDDEFEIFGQRLDADGNEIGTNDFRISDAGGTGSPSYLAAAPAVACNPIRGEYLVVWWGDDDVGGLIDNELEIFGQRLDADGNEIGANDFRISDAGGTGDSLYQAFSPAASFNPSAGEYQVVWYGTDDVGGLDPGETEIFRQLLDADGQEVGANDHRISFMAGTGNPDYGATDPATAFKLAVWSGSDDDGLALGEFEIFGRLLATGILFSDGFESGDTGAWSETVPPPPV